jgi:hypothetical protein
MRDDDSRQPKRFWGDRGEPVAVRRRSTPEEALRKALEGRLRLRAQVAEAEARRAATGAPEADGGTLH